MSKKDYMAGMLRVLLLHELNKDQGYGYGLAKGIEKSSGGELDVRPESLYPVLHRMEQEQLVTSAWDHAATGRPRKIYELTPRGQKRWEVARKEFVALSHGALRALDSLGEIKA